jgi:hypothetical protein
LYYHRAVVPIFGSGEEPRVEADFAIHKLAEGHKLLAAFAAAGLNTLDCDLSIPATGEPETIETLSYWDRDSEQDGDIWVRNRELIAGVEEGSDLHRTIRFLEEVRRVVDPLPTEDGADNTCRTYGQLARFSPEVTQLFFLPFDVEAPRELFTRVMDGDLTAATRLWPDYRQLGIGERHVPELIAACRTDKFAVAHMGDLITEGNAHAWRALGQIATPEALDFLTSVLERMWDDHAYSDLLFDDDADRMDELGPILSQAGEAAVDRMVRVMNGPGSVFTRDAAGLALACIAHKHPELRARALREIVAQLENPNNDEEMTTAWLGVLIPMRAVEAAGAIERQFSAGRIDSSSYGDWKMVRAELGLTTA